MAGTNARLTSTQICRIGLYLYKCEDVSMSLLTNSILSKRRPEVSSRYCWSVVLLGLDRNSIHWPNLIHFFYT